MDFILASASPRRRRLLSECGYAFDVAPSDVPEIRIDADPVRTVVGNASAKAGAVAMINPGVPVLGADTVVWRDGRLLGKPRDIAEAAEMLAWLSGRSHAVFTGVALLAPGAARPTVRVEASEVVFRELSAEDIVAYIGKVAPFDRAGAYDLSDYGEIVVREVVGSYSNVVGLPMETVRAMLADAGIRPAGQDKAAGPSGEEGLVVAAVDAASRAYAKYSGFRVGAALLSADGRVFTGCNVENGSYGLTNCAERTAVFKAVSEGVRDFAAIAVAGGAGTPAYPCGACRQVLAEFCQPSMPVICSTLGMDRVERFTLGALLPQSFAL